MPQKGVEHRYDDLGALQRETLLTDVAGVEEMLKKSSLAELVEDFELFVPAEPGPVARRFHSLLEPEPSREGPEGACTQRQPTRSRLSRSADTNLPERGLLPEKGGRGVEKPVKVLFGETETGKVEQRMRVLASVQRVQAGQNVAQIAVAIDEFLYAALPQHFFFVAKARAHLLGTAASSKPSKKIRHSRLTLSGFDFHF